MSKHLPALRTRAAVVATSAAAATLFAVLPAATTASPPAPATGPVSAPVHAALPAALPAAADAPVELTVEPVASSTSTAAAALDHAMGKVGAPYRWGASGPSAFDCSGLVHWAFGSVGVDLPRTSRAQSGVGTPVSKSDLQPGDLVFFYSPVSHVGIYAGDGKIVHASTSGKPVKVADMSGMPFNSARRV